jgi:NADH-quinone oxidoreductase subunit G
VAWGEVLPAIDRDFREVASQDGAGVVGVLSPFLTCEEAFLLAKYLKAVSGQARIALGPVPVLGADDTFPKDRRGRPVQPVKFTIRAEKCPNRKGVEAILRHFHGQVVPFDEVSRWVAQSQVRALYLAGGYPHRRSAWITPEQAAALDQVGVVVVHDLFESPASARANYVLPAASFAEKDGTFVNHRGLAQAIHWAVRPRHEIRTDGRVFLELLGRRGLVHAPSLRSELGREVPYFAPLAQADPGYHGILLDEAAKS